MREQVLERFREWDRQGVPAWTYSLLIARFFQCLSDGPEPRAVSLCDGVRALVWWVAESAERGAVGRTLTPDEVNEAFRLAQVRWPWPEQYSDYWVPPYVEWLTTA